MQIITGARFKVDTYSIPQYPERVVDIVTILQVYKVSALVYSPKLQTNILVPLRELREV